MNYKEVEDILGVTFESKALLDEAFTHRSYAAEKGCASYERLEFLGDGVLESVVCAFLYERVRGDEGKLTANKCRIVCAPSLYRAAKALHLGRFVRVSRHLAENGEFRWPLDDIYEAVVGAIYLDGGHTAARDFVARTLLQNSADFGHKSYKSLLQERMQRLYKENVVRYETVRNAENGGIARRYISRVCIRGIVVAQGAGRNKRTAEMQAAKRYLEEVCGPEI